MNRGQFCVVLISTNKTGKTTLGIKMIVRYMKAYPQKRTLIILSDDGEDKFANIEEIEFDDLLTFKGVKKIIINDHRDFERIADLFKSYKDPKTGKRVVRKFNGLMVCDDLGGAMNRRPEEILNFFRKRRQPNIDFLFMFHGLRTQVPPSFYTFITSIVLGRTSDNPDGIIKELADDGTREKFKEMYLRVQKETLTNMYYKEELILNPTT